MEIPTLTDGVVTLRAYRPEDAEPMTRALQDWDTVKWLVTPTWPYPHEESVEWIESIAPTKWADGSACWFAVADAATDAYLGDAGLRTPDPAGRVWEIGYLLVPWARGHGYMTRAVRLLVGWAFDALDCDRIDWGAAVGNDPSRRVAEANGFVVEGVRRQGMLRRSDQTRHDEWTGGLLRDDWAARGNA
ncbi:MAG: GNAT family N-acetyltransferase [Candidatus Nanopelagicales bacterium]